MTEGGRDSAGAPLAFRIALPLVALLFAVALVELGLRLWGYDPLARISRGREVFIQESDHPNLEYEPRPGARGFAWGAPIAINSHGFRDRELALEKPPGVKRIAVIGDSITFGNALAPAETYPGRLQGLLAASGLRAEVLNLGVTGYDTLNEVAFLEKRGLAFDPDLVIVGFSFNDLGVHSVSLRTLGVLWEVGWLTRHLRVVQLFRVEPQRVRIAREVNALNREGPFRERYADRIAPLAGDAELAAKIERLEAELAGIPADRQSRFLPWFVSEARIGRLRYAFDWLGRLREAHGFEVIVMVVPFLDESQGTPAAFRGAYDVVIHEARRAGFAVVDLHEPFLDHGLEPLRLDVGTRFDSLHPNAAGHRIMARELLAPTRAILRPSPGAAGRSGGTGRTPGR